MLLTIPSGQGSGRFVEIAVMTDLVAGGVHSGTDIRIVVDRVPGDKPGRRDSVFFEKSENPVGADETELAAGNLSWCREVAKDPGRDDVKIESQADEVTRHR